MDTTYFSRTFGVMLFQDASSGKILCRKFVKNETNRDYLDGLRYIAERGTVIKAVVYDGHVGLLQAISFCPVQMCQFHQFQIVRRLLTNNPHLPAGVELLALMRRMFSMRKDEFITAFDKWKEFLNDRTLLISGKTTYTHRRLRTARRSIKTHLPWLYTCEDGLHLHVSIMVLVIKVTNMIPKWLKIIRFFQRIHLRDTKNLKLKCPQDNLN